MAEMVLGAIALYAVGKVLGAGAPARRDVRHAPYRRPEWHPAAMAPRVPAAVVPPTVAEAKPAEAKPAEAKPATSPPEARAGNPAEGTGAAPPEARAAAAETAASWSEGFEKVDPRTYLQPARASQ